MNKIYQTEVITYTSGWQYSDWNSRFYYDGIKAKDKLAYFAEHFNSVEINITYFMFLVRVAY